MAASKLVAPGAVSPGRVTVMRCAPPGSGSGTRLACSQWVHSTLAPLCAMRYAIASGPKPVKMGT